MVGQYIGLSVTKLRAQVLAMGIVIVFFSGLIKLWSSNRQMRRVEQLDAERQARIVQMRKSGLSASGRYRLGSEIPFGVKALDEGVEVDGIWVAKMASMASQPPNRKWSSRRKLKVPVSSIIEMNELGSSNKRAVGGSRGSRRAGKISRREIVEPSHQTREKLNNMSPLEKAVEGSGDEQARAVRQGHKGPIGRIQRSLKKMTSLEMWQDQERKRSAGRVDANEFHEKAQAKKPRRFYPENSTTSNTVTPLVEPKARSQTAQQRLEDLLTTHGASQTGGPSGHNQVELQYGKVDKVFAGAHPAQSHGLQQQSSADPPSPSVDSFVTTAEGPQKPLDPVRLPRPHARLSSEDRHTPREAPLIPVRRSSRSSEDRVSRRSTEGRRSEDSPRQFVQTVQAPISPVARYPPNSSRSGPVVQRSLSSSQHQKQQQQIASKPPSPRFNLSEV